MRFMFLKVWKLICPSSPDHQLSPLQSSSPGPEQTLQRLLQLGSCWAAGDCSTAGQGCRHCRHRPAAALQCGVTWLRGRDAATTADTADTAAPGKLAGTRHSPGLNYLSSPEPEDQLLLPPGPVIASGLASLLSSHSVPSTVNCCRRRNNKSRSHYFPYLFSFLSQSFVVSSTAPRHNTEWANQPRRTKTCLETRG